MKRHIVNMLIIYLFSIFVYPNSDTALASENKNYVEIQNNEVIVSDGNTIIEEYAFAGRTDITSIIIPDSVTSIGNSAFFGCTNLESITLSNALTSIDDFAFWGCSSLASIIIPDSVTTMGQSIFQGCSSLSSIKLPNNIAQIGEATFLGCSSLNLVEIPEGTTNIGTKAFMGCSSLTSVSIPNTVTNIEYKAFQYCSSLTDLILPDNLTNIDYGVFDGCSNLELIKLPESVTGIDNFSFSNCENLKTIIIPESTAYISAGAFQNTPITIYGINGSYAQKYAVENNISFFDIIPSEWAKADIEKAKELNFIPEELQYSYKENISMEEFARIALNFAAMQYDMELEDFLEAYCKSHTDESGNPMKYTGDIFSDINDYYINWAYTLGIINGQDNGAFDPAGSITRQEAAVMLLNTYLIYGDNIEHQENSIEFKDKFSDTNLIADWAYDSVSYMWEWSVMSGIGEDYFDPLGCYTKEQCIITFIRLYENAPQSKLFHNINTLNTQ